MVFALDFFCFRAGFCFLLCCAMFVFYVCLCVRMRVFVLVVAIGCWQEAIVVEAGNSKSN